LRVRKTISSTATTLPYSATCNTDVIVKCIVNGGTQTKYDKTGSFIIPANTTTGSVKYIISAFCADYPDVWISSSTTQSSGQTTDPIITSLTLAPNSIPATGGSVTFNVTTLPASTDVRVKCGTDQRSAKSGTFSIPENIQQAELIHVVSAWCVGYEDVVVTSAITQSAATQEITDIKFDSVQWVTDVPRSGGTATSANCSFNVIAFFSNGTSRDITDFMIEHGGITGSQYVPASSENERHQAGYLTIFAQFSNTGNTFNDSATVQIYQAGAPSPSFNEITIETEPDE
jgi:hypothetical protein